MSSAQLALALALPEAPRPAAAVPREAAPRWRWRGPRWVVLTSPAELGDHVDPGTPIHRTRSAARAAAENLPDPAGVWLARVRRWCIERIALLHRSDRGVQLRLAPGSCACGATFQVYARGPRPTHCEACRKASRRDLFRERARARRTERELRTSHG